MNFASYQSNTKNAVPYQHYTEPFRVSYNNRGEQALAHANAETVGVLVKGLQDMKDQYDSGKVMEANNEYNRLMTEGSMELMQKKQENALNVVDEYDTLHQKTLEKVRKKYGQFINYGKAGQAFNIYTERDNNTRRANMLKYQMAETDAYHETQYNNQLATCMEIVGSGGYSDEAIAEGVNRAFPLVQQRYAKYGNEMIKNQMRAVQGSMVSTALQFAINTQDYARVDDICNKYAKVIDPKALVSAKSMTMKRAREEKELSFHQRMIRDIGNNASNDAVREYVVNNWNLLHPPTGNYKGTDADAWKEAQWVEQQTGLKAEWIYRQWAHESAYFSSQLARENNNFGGLTQVEWNGDDNKQPDGNNYYREFKNFHEYAEAYVQDFIDLYEGQESVHDLASFAHYLKDNGYYGADEADYLAAMESVDMELEDDSVEQSVPNGVELENAIQDALKYRDQQRNLEEAENRRIVKHYTNQIQDLSNRGEATPEALRALVDEATAASGYNDDVRIPLETAILAEEKRQQKAIEQAAKGAPSEKVDSTLEDYLISRISEGGVKSKAAIVDICNELGITSPSEQKKCTKLFDDYLNNKGVFSIDYKTIEAYVPEFENIKGQAKARMAHTIHELARSEAKLYMAEHDGQMPEEVQLAELVSKAFTEKVVTGGRTMEDSWLGRYFGKDITISKADLAANGYANAKYIGDGEYMLLKLDGTSADYMTEEELLAMVGRSGYVEP